jgi:hypothetical protein
VRLANNAAASRVAGNFYLPSLDSDFRFKV